MGDALTVPHIRGAQAVARARISMDVINESIDKDSPKVVHTITVSDLLEDKGTVKALGVGKKAVMCRCWKSGTFPLCDAAHVKHNKETGDNVGPLIIDNDTK